MTGESTGELLNSCLSDEGGKTLQSGSRARGLVVKPKGRAAVLRERRVIPAKLMEGRAPAKRNSEQEAANRIQGRKFASIGMQRVRQGTSYSR